MKQVVAQHQGGGLASEEVGADQEGLGQAIGTGLDRVANLHTPGRAIAEKALEGGLIVGGADDQDLADPRQHQGAERVIDHRLVVDRHQLLAHRRGQRSQARTAATGQDDPAASRRRCRSHPAHIIKRGRFSHVPLALRLIWPPSRWRRRRSPPPAVPKA